MIDRNNADITQRIPSASRVSVEVNVVARLVEENFPDLAGLPVTPVPQSGWDNHTFRLGTKHKVRMPASAVYLSQLEKEITWLPKLAPHLPVQVPEPVGRGHPGHGYPFPWSVWRWIDGDVAISASISDLTAFAEDIANFLNALMRCPTDGAPASGRDNFYRGGDLSVYDRQTRDCLTRLSGIVDAERLAGVWQEAISTRWECAPVWVHGDVAAGNLLLKDGRLHAVIDFGSSACGDPACDLVVNWTMFNRAARARFRQLYEADAATWARARGWCLWKALLVMAENDDSESVHARELEVLSEMMDDIEHLRGGE